MRLTINHTNICEMVDVLSITYHETCYAQNDETDEVEEALPSIIVRFLHETTRKEQALRIYLPSEEMTCALYKDLMKQWIEDNEKSNVTVINTLLSTKKNYRRYDLLSSLLNSFRVFLSRENIWNLSNLIDHHDELCNKEFNRLCTEAEPDYKEWSVQNPQATYAMYWDPKKDEIRKEVVAANDITEEMFLSQLTIFNDAGVSYSAMAQVIKEV